MQRCLSSHVFASHLSPRPPFISPPDALLNLTVTNLGYVAVDEAVFIIHNEVFEVLGGKHLALPGVAQTRLLQQLPATLERPLSRQQLQLLVM